MGFSFGSFVTHFAVAEDPSIADAAILTAINYNTTGLNIQGLLRSFVPRIASLQSPRRFGSLDPGYLTWVDETAQINTYFKYPFYSLATTSYAEEEKQPFAIGEFLTIADGEFDASGFTGAALVCFSYSRALPLLPFPFLVTLYFLPFSPYIVTIPISNPLLTYLVITGNNRPQRLHHLRRQLRRPVRAACTHYMEEREDFYPVFTSECES